MTEDVKIPPAQLKQIWVSQKMNGLPYLHKYGNWRLNLMKNTPEGPQQIGVLQFVMEARSGTHLGKPARFWRIVERNHKIVVEDGVEVVTAP